MLPSSGYFKDVACPFFKSGLCERPHCHFNHAKTDLVGRYPLCRNVFEDELDDSDSRAELLHLMNIANQRTHNDISRNELVPKIEVDPHTYIPTPVEKRKTASILKSNKSAKFAVSSIPEYRPTPIAELKKILNCDSNISSDLTFNPLSINRKRRKVEEYDPAEVKCSGKKRVSFVLPGNSVSDVNNIASEISTNSSSIPSECTMLDSSDDEDTGTGITPQFSDDDDDVICVKTVINNTKTQDLKHVSSNSNKNEETPPVDEEASEVSKSPDRFSLVDRILVDVKRNKELMEDFKRPFTKPLHSHFDSKAESKDSHETKTRRTDSVTKRLLLSDKQSSKPKGAKNSAVVNIAKVPKVSKKHNSGESLDRAIEDKFISLKKKKKIPKDNSNKNSTVCKEDIKSQLEKGKEEKCSEVNLKDPNCDKKEKVTKKSTISKSSEESNVRHSLAKKDNETLIKSKYSSGEKRNSAKIQDKKISSSSHSNHKSGNDHGKSKSVMHSGSLKMSSKITKACDETVKKSEKSLSQCSSKVADDLKWEKAKNKSSDKNSEKISTTLKQSKSDRSFEIPEPVKQSLDSYEDVHFPDADSDVDSDTYEECLRIFNEADAQPVIEENSTVEDSETGAKSSKDEILVLGKKRIAHQLSLSRPRVPKLRNSMINPAQVMQNRYSKLQQIYSRQNTVEVKKVPPAFVSSCRNNDSNKKRIANVPNADLVAAVTQKQKSLQSSCNTSVISEESKGERPVISAPKRVAHIPLSVTKSRPIIPVEYGCKVPVNIRQRYLNNFIDECLKFCLTEDEAYETALEEEKNTYKRSVNKTIYLNLAINVLKRLRNRAEEGPKQADNLQQKDSKLLSKSSLAGALEKPISRVVSHEAMLCGAKAQRFSFSIEKKKTKVETQIAGKMLYDLLSIYVLNSTQLVDNGFPQAHPTEAGRAVICGIYNSKNTASKDRTKRICSRCQKFYFVDEIGGYMKKEECDYHWGRLFKRRVAGTIESRYSCCDGDSQSEGCCVGAGHVFDGFDPKSLTGCVKTLPKTPPPDGYFGVYSLDCEMCYTTAGIELIRITVINPDLKPVYETFVKPDHPVLDYNTRFSGIVEENLLGVKTSIRDVQAVLLCLFNDKTILIGHSLESDFKALKLIHNTVVDTSVVFPHRRGPPVKRALRTLMAEMLQKIIQNSVDGHDSNEDAVACMELMLWKIKEDVKLSNR